MATPTVMGAIRRGLRGREPTLEALTVSVRSLFFSAPFSAEEWPRLILSNPRALRLLRPGLTRRQERRAWARWGGRGIRSRRIRLVALSLAGT